MEGQHGTQGGGRAGKNGSPRLNLPQARAYKRFKIGELFELRKGKRLTKRDMLPGATRFIGATASNNGITASIGNVGHVLPANTVTVSYNGSVGEAFYQDEPYWASDDINALIPRFKMSRESALFISAAIRAIGKKYAYNFKWAKEIMEQDYIVLPSSSNGVPDFAYMEAYIRELEAARLRELEAARLRELEKYLAAAGFNDCKLTKAERMAVEDLTNDNVPVRTFKIADLFSVDTPQRRFNANAVKFGGVHPYVVRTSQNNGQRETIIADEKWLNPGNTISFGQDTATIFYQPKDYFTGDKIKVMKPLGGSFNERIACFCLATMRKAFSTFAWGRSSFNEKVLKEVEVSLPITTGGEIDYAFIETFIRGMMKRAIGGVIVWKDKEIAATKSVIGK